MSSRRTNDIEVLSERLGSLQINEEASSNKQTNTEMSTAPAVTPAVNESAGMPRSMVPDPRWYQVHKWWT